MRIGYDARLTTHGIGRVNVDLLAHMVRKSPDDLFLVLTASEADARRFEQLSPNIRGCRVPVPIHGISEQAYLPVWIARNRIDLFHATSFPSPVMRTCPFVVTIHDLIPKVRDEYWPPLRGIRKPLSHAYYHLMTWYAVSFSAHIATVSHQAKDEIRHFFPAVPEEKISVVYNAVADDFATASEDKIAAVRLRYGLPQDYLLFVGTYNPRKNLLGVMRAIAELRQIPGWRHKLVVAARQDERYPAIPEFMRQHRLEADIQLLGYVDKQDLPAVYSGATALVFPSFHESYGIPLVEAFACGTPVIASNTTALPEIGGDAPLYVDPGNTDQIKATILRILSDAALRSRMIAKGISRVQQFSWEHAADQMLAIYHRCGRNA